MLQFNNWTLTVTGLIARQYDNMSRRIDIEGPLPEGYTWQLLVQSGGNADTILLESTETGAGAVLTADNLSKAGEYYIQLRGVLEADGVTRRHTNVVSAYIPESLTGLGTWPEVPTEFAQVEARILELYQHPPIPGSNGYWLVWDTDKDEYVESQLALPEAAAGGTSDHSKLKNRDAVDQHPMSAITGLEKALEGKQPTGSYLTDKDLDTTITMKGKAADAKAVGDALRSLSEEIANLPTATTRTFKTQAIGELFDRPENYTAWCSGSLHYDDKLGKFVDLLYAAPKHENPEYKVNFVTYIDPKTYEATAPVLCKYYDTDGITELTISYAARPAFVILRDGSYMMLQTIGSMNYRFISTDYGLTWVKREQITGYSGSTETYALVQLSNGRLLANAISRVINYSDDNGITWTSVTPVTSGASYEAEYCFLEVKSGVVLGICRKTVSGVGRAESGEAEHAVITVSEDYGTTWSDLKESETINNMNASTCTGYVHDGIVEIFAASRWYNNGDYAVTDYANTGKSGAITHYVATIENALKDKFTKLGITVYAKTMGNATTLAAQDFHTPCIAVNGDDMLMVYFDRVAPYNVPDNVNHHYIRGSLTGIDYGIRDDLKSPIFPYSSAQTEKLLKKQYNELIVKINEAILSGEVIPPGEDEDGNPTSYILDGIVANFNFLDASKVDETAKTVTDTINGIVATCTSETFPEKRDNSLGIASYTVPAVSDYYGSTSIDNGFSVEICIYRYDGDAWIAHGFWWTTKAPTSKYWITGDSSQASRYTYIDTGSVINKTALWWGSSSMPIPSGTLGFVHIVATYDVNGTLTIYKNGEALKTITPTDFSAWDSELVTAVTRLSESMKAYRIYNRALTAEEVASNYKYELSIIV